MLKFDVENFVTKNEKIHQGYNKIIQDEMRTIHDHMNGLINDPFDSLYSLNEIGLIISNKNHDALSEFIQDHDPNNNIIVLSGPLIKNYLVNNNDIINIPLLNTCNVSLIHNDLINVNYDTEYVYNGIKFYIETRRYTSPAHALLTKPICDRIGMFNNIIYASYTFIIDLYKKILSYDSTHIDPVYKCPVDILDIYDKKQLQRNELQYLIDRADFNEIKKMQIRWKNIIQYNNSNYNIAEYALTRLTLSHSPYVTNVIKDIIMYFITFKYTRPPIFLAMLLEINKNHGDLYEVMLLNENNGSKLLLQHDIEKLLVEIEKTVCKTSLVNTSSIDLCILKYLIKNDDVKSFLMYGSELGYLKKMTTISKTGDKFAQWIMTFNATRILKELINCNILNDYYKNKLILLTQCTDLIKLINMDKHDLSEFIDDVIKNNAVKSFVFLTESYPNILNRHEQTHASLLHAIKHDKLCEIVKIIKQKSPDLLGTLDTNGRTPLLLYSELGMCNCINELICDNYTNIDLLNKTDNKGNNFIHNLCQNGHYNILKSHVAHVQLNVINMQNNAMETPAMLACKNKHELIFYLLKSNNADLDICDQYGNSVYHYICLNGICPGITINNKKNNFGFSPSDYCTISLDFYYFN